MMASWTGVLLIASWFAISCSPGRPEEFHLQPPTEPPLDLHGSPLPCHLAMTVDAESDRSSRLPGWPSLSIRFAPRSLQALRHYYRMIRPRHAHRYFPPSCFALIRVSLRLASRVPKSRPQARIRATPPAPRPPQSQSAAARHSDPGK